MSLMVISSCLNKNQDTKQEKSNKENRDRKKYNNLYKHQQKFLVKTNHYGENPLK